MLHQDLRGDNAFELHCPRAAPSVGVVSCTYHQWFRPYSKRRRYCHLPVSGRRMQRFLHLVYMHCLLSPAITCGQHVDRADRICSHCGQGSLADELHVVHECPVLRPLTQQCVALFTPETDTMRSFFWTERSQCDSHAGFLFYCSLSRYPQSLIRFSDTCDQTCWLACACNSLSHACNLMHVDVPLVRMSHVHHVPISKLFLLV